MKWNVLIFFTDKFGFGPQRLGVKYKNGNKNRLENVSWAGKIEYLHPISISIRVTFKNKS